MESQAKSRPGMWPSVAEEEEQDDYYMRHFGVHLDQIPEILRGIPLAERNALRRLPRPDEEDNVIVVEFDDVVAMTTQSIVDGLQAAGRDVSIQDFESVYLHQCKGFGRPSEVVEILRHVTPSRLKMMDIVLESLQRLNCMGYRVVIATSRPDDKEEKAFVWMQNWLGDRHVRIGNRGLVLKLAFPVDNQSTRVRDEVMSIGVDMTLPGGVAIDQEDERIICEMRHREPEREVYCREFESMWEKMKPSVYISASAQDVKRLLELSAGTSQVPKMLLFGDYAWNGQQVDWTSPSAWWSHQERIDAGVELGVAYGLEGVDKVKDWDAVVDWAKSWMGRTRRFSASTSDKPHVR